MKIELKEKCFKGMSGAYAAMFTPFTAKNLIDEEAIARLVEHGIRNGLTGFYLTGGTGEWFLLEPEERRTVWKAAVKAARGRCKLIAHVGAHSTEEAVLLAKMAADCGVDWISAVPPMADFCHDADGVYHHYKLVSEATDLPFMIYAFNTQLVPARDIRFFGLRNVKGIKYTGADYYSAQCLKHDLDKRKETIWFAGKDEQLLCALALGNVFSGGIGTTYNIIPKHFVKICDCAWKNDFDAGMKWQDEANRVVRLMIDDPNWCYRKKMMEFVGIDCGWARPPFRPLTPAEKRDYFRRFAALGIVRRGYAAR